VNTVHTNKVSFEPELFPTVFLPKPK